MLKVALKIFWSSWFISSCAIRGREKIADSPKVTHLVIGRGKARPCVTLVVVQFPFVSLFFPTTLAVFLRLWCEQIQCMVIWGGEKRISWYDTYFLYLMLFELSRNQVWQPQRDFLYRLKWIFFFILEMEKTCVWFNQLDLTRKWGIRDCTKFKLNQAIMLYKSHVLTLKSNSHT